MYKRFIIDVEDTRTNNIVRILNTDSFSSAWKSYHDLADMIVYNNTIGTSVTLIEVCQDGSKILMKSCIAG